MATNVFFSPKVRSEQHLYEDIVIEALKMYGQDVFYIPRTQIKQDEILNDDYSKYEAAYVVEMYIADADGFGGEGNLMTKFGLEIRDEATFIVSRRRFEQLVDIDGNSIRAQRPREGDLIYLPLSKSLFEIKFVEHEKPFYQLSNLPTYELQCALFEYNSEEFNTAIPEVDRFEQIYATSETLLIEGGVYGFAPGDRISQELVPLKLSSGIGTTVLDSGGSVDSVTITNGGFGYTSAPLVIFEDPPAGLGSVTASGTSVIQDGIVVDVIITDPGNNYVTRPSITFGDSPVSDIPAVEITGEVALFTETRAAAGLVTRQATLRVVAVRSSVGDYRTFAITDLTNNIGRINNLENNNDGWSITQVYTVNSNGLDIAQEPLAQNEIFETTADGIIDFSESNPFGDPSTE